MEYRLIIDSVNPHPEAGKEYYTNYGGRGTYPQEIETRLLEVRLTEEEWKGVKAAVLLLTNPSFSEQEALALRKARGE